MISTQYRKEFSIFTRKRWSTLKRVSLLSKFCFRILILFSVTILGHKFSQKLWYRVRNVLGSRNDCLDYNNFVLSKDRKKRFQHNTEKNLPCLAGRGGLP